ncbi:pali-domain-containing protein [Cystobasidium minutum MCA 4210]|uniref:pali-domain-containing protein n=1 Tax=Cystobasidium minutum MCA 4210 TaxID=1397322 RepID=UPI0034CD1149|eukprot:jgi/Rhomi1/166946/fgenesh1_kg.2_\
MACTLHQGPGVFFLFCAFVLLIITSVSVPVWDAIRFLRIQTGGTEARLGTWGYCVIQQGVKTCSNSRLGYDADDIVEIFSDGGNISNSVIRGLTYALVLHPIAAGITLFALIISLTTNWCLDICGSLFSFFAFLVALVAFIVDSVLFVTARTRINNDIAGSPASLSNAYWMTLAAVISLLLAAFTVCCGSMTARRRKAREERAATAPMMSETNAYGEPAPRRKWWQRRRY